MAVGRSPDKEREYVLKEDRELPREQQTRIGYRLLDCDGYYDAIDDLVEIRDDEASAKKKRGEERSSTTKLRQGTNERDTLLNNITRLDNFKDEDGNDVLWPAKTDRKGRIKALSYFSAKQRREIAKVIQGDSQMSEDERGNSDSPSGSD
jgi:hypothetical protein